MNNENLLQNIILSIVIALVVSFVVVSVAKPKIDFGGYTAGHWDSADGYKVDGTTVIDGDGNYDGAITGTSATLSSTLTVTGETNLVNLIFGGVVWSTSSDVHATLSAAEICDNSVIRFDPHIPAVNLTLPSTSTLYADCIPAAGDTKIVMLENATSGTANITIVAGTGITLLEPSGGDVVIAQDEWAFLRFTYVDGMECAVTVTSIQNAD